MRPGLLAVALLAASGCEDGGIGRTNHEQDPPSEDTEVPGAGDRATDDEASADGDVAQTGPDAIGPGSAPEPGAAPAEPGPCGWEAREPTLFCREPPCAITRAWRLECPAAPQSVGLVASEASVRIGYYDGDEYHLDEVSPEAPRAVDLAGVDVSRTSDKTLLVSPTELLSARDGGCTLFTESGPSEWSARAMNCAPGTVVRDARVLPNGHLSILLGADTPDDGAPARVLDSWSTGTLMEIPGHSGTAALTPEGSVLSERQNPALGVPLWSRTGTTEVQPLFRQLSEVGQLAVTDDGVLAVLSDIENFTIHVPFAPRTLYTRLDLLEGGELRPLFSGAPEQPSSCSGISLDVTCPTEQDTDSLGTGFDQAGAVTTSTGNWVWARSASGTVTCEWVAVFCDSSGFCSHDRGCEQMATTHYSYSLDIYATSRPDTPSLAIPLATAVESTAVVAQGDAIHVAVGDDTGLYLLTVDATQLSREPVALADTQAPATPTPELPPVLPTTSAPTPPCQNEVYADLQGDALDIAIVTQIQATNLRGVATRTRSDDGGMAALFEASGTFRTPSSTIDIPSGSIDVVARFNPDGTVAWVKPTSGALGLAISNQGDTLVVGGPWDPQSPSPHEHLSKFDADGNPLWVLDFGARHPSFSSVTVLGDGRIVAAQNGTRLVTFSPEGVPLAGLDLPGTVLALDRLSDDRLAIAGRFTVPFEWGESQVASADEDSVGVLAIASPELEPLWAAVGPLHTTVEQGSTLWVLGADFAGRVEERQIEPALLGSLAARFTSLAPLQDGNLALVGMSAESRAVLEILDASGTPLSSSTFDSRSVGVGPTLWADDSSGFWAFTSGVGCGDTQVATLARLGRAE